MKPFNSLFLCLVTCFLCLSCEKIGKKVENYDLFGLERANEATKIQQEKINKAREQQRSMRTIREDAYNSPNILGGGQ